MISKTTLSLAASAALVLGTTAALADGTTPAPQRTEVRKTSQVIVLGDHAAVAGSDPHQIMVTARSVDGADPSLKVKMLDGDDAETLDVADLAVGETKTFTTKSGKDVVVARNENGVTLTVDGKEVNLPSLGEISMLPGGQGLATVSAFSTVDDDDADGDVHDKNVFVMAGAPHVLIGTPNQDFEHLKALEGLDPAVRDATVAALKEIFSNPDSFGFSFQIPAPGDAATPLPGQHVVVKHVVVDDKDHADGRSTME